MRFSGDLFYTVFIMNDRIKNLSGQDIENLIELYRLEGRCLWDSSDADYLDADPQITGMHDNVFL